MLFLQVNIWSGQTGRRYYDFFFPRKALPSRFERETAQNFLESLLCQILSQKINTESLGIFPSII